MDLGTTFTAAAVWREGATAPEIISLGSRSSATPSVLFCRADGGVVVGEAAVTRAAESPERVAREFKRRIGDPAPIFVGGSPWSPEALSAELLRWVLARITEVEGGPPERLVLTHPANWGTYKVEQLRQVLALADVAVPTALLSEPEAAAIHYAAVDRVPEGATVAVYDLGGGTFDATVLRVTDRSAQVLGAPDGIERLGGVDVDAAVFEHVRSNAADLFDGLDPDDPTALAAVGQVREACQRAKEALSAEADTTVMVALPTGVVRVRLTRQELEAAIRPQLEQTVAAMHRALHGAGVDAADLDRVLLVGGSSRIPLVAELLAGALGRPIAVDTDPKHAIAMGAARAALDDARFGLTPAPAVAAVPPIEAVPTDDSLTTSPPIPAAPTKKRNPALLVGAVVAVLALVALAATQLGGGDGGDVSAGDTTGADDEEADPSPADSEGAGVVAVISTIAGTGAAGYSGDEVDAIDAQLDGPSAVVVDGDGRIIIADSGNDRIRAINLDGSITTIAGGDEPGYAGDGGPAVDALLAGPSGLVIDEDGRILVADSENNRVRAIDPDGTIETIAGAGTGGFGGDGGPASDALLAFPRGLALGDDGTLYVADTGNNRIRAVDPDGSITTVAGRGEQGFEGDGGPAVDALLDFPRSLALAGDLLLVADTGNSRIRAVDLGDASITTIAGTAAAGSAGDGGPATNAQLNLPRGVLVDGGGRILIADTDNSRVRVIDEGGTITTVAGAGTAGYNGDDMAATDARLASPRGIAVDGDGRIIIADSDNHRIRVVG